ncbi:MAG: hypothetical protein DRI23_13245 [Candidatus Cloacimonadota bacterium]|nr:MAG: hypothetical protein DRI23_13245 [Candidatus Cloacimonadota bacterium]
MKKIISIILLSLMILPNLGLADGIIIEPYYDHWRPIEENGQVAVINYQNGMEKLIISVNFNSVNAEKAAWIFPVPSNPNDVAIDILKDFPRLYGYNIVEKTKSDIDRLIDTTTLTQIYPFLFRQRTYPVIREFLAGKMSIESTTDVDREEVTVYEHIEKEGFTTEVVTASSGDALYNYLKEHGLNVKTQSIPVLDDYIGKDYTFVITWLTPIEKQRIYCEESRPHICYEIYNPVCGSDGKTYSNNCIACSNEKVEWYTEGACNFYRYGRQPGIFITFPTKEIYYPMIPTSIYGSKTIPVTLYVLGHVTPKLNNEIKAYTKIGYYYQRYLDTYEFKSFYGNLENNIKYTKIEIEAPSKYYTKDICFKQQAPSNIIYANSLCSFISNHSIIALITLILLISFLAGGISGIFIFRNFKDFAILGLANIFSIIGLIIAIMTVKTSRREEEIIRKLKHSGYLVISTDKRKLYFIVLFSIVFIILGSLVGYLLKIPLL